ncbi:MAG: heme-binding domain-containing protein [Candidatus Binataceae bacterium]
MTLKKLAWVAALAVSVVLLAVQLVLVNRINPPSLGTFAAPPQIDATLKRACYDCHSNETRWRWYSRVAPLSWFTVHDVTLGRKEANFSEWGIYCPATRRRKLEWMGRALREENMPPWSYRLLHPGARLTEADRAAVQRWIESALATLSTENK